MLCVYNTLGGGGYEKRLKKFWSVNVKGRDHLEDLGINGKIILELILGKYSGNVWTGCIWLRVGTSGGLL
jgi:hypothetical protein